MANTGNYKIVKSQLPLIGGTAGHNFIAVLDPKGRAIHELNGLATSKDGEIKPIGYLPSDILQVYNEKRANMRFYHSSQNQEVVFEGSYQKVMQKFNLGYEIGREINKRNFPYPILGLGENSNSVASTLLKGMGLKDPDLGMALTPGEGSLLIPEDELKRIRQNWEQKHNISDMPQSQRQSKYDEVKAMLQGLLNDTDGSYAQKVLAEHPEQVARFDEKVRQSMEEEQSKQQALAERESQIQQETQQRGFSRSFG